MRTIVHEYKSVDVTIDGSDVYHIADVLILSDGTEDVTTLCDKPNRSGKYQPYPEGSIGKRLCGRCRRALDRR